MKKIIRPLVTALTLASAMSMVACSTYEAAKVNPTSESAVSVPVNNTQDKDASESVPVEQYSFRSEISFMQNTAALFEKDNFVTTTLTGLQEPGETSVSNYFDFETGAQYKFVLAKNISGTHVCPYLLEVEDQVVKNAYYRDSRSEGEHFIPDYEAGANPELLIGLVDSQGIDFDQAIELVAIEACTQEGGIAHWLNYSSDVFMRDTVQNKNFN